MAASAAGEGAPSGWSHCTATPSGCDAFAYDGSHRITDFLDPRYTPPAPPTPPPMIIARFITESFPWRL